MAKVSEVPVPEGSLLAQFGGGPRSKQEPYRDCWMREVPGMVSLEEFVTRFYCSPAFRPERLLLSLISRGASNADAEKLARGEAGSFAAWNVVERRGDELLLQDFRGATASWLSVEMGDPSSSSEAVGQQKPSTKLLFGSWVGEPDRGVVKALMPFHRWYSRVLLGGV